MNRAHRLTAAVGATLVVGAALAAALPMQFVEDRLGVSPDAGSGALELLVVLALLAAGAALLVRSTAVARVRQQWAARDRRRA